MSECRGPGCTHPGCNGDRADTSAADDLRSRLVDALDAMDHTDGVVTLSLASWWSGYKTAKEQAVEVVREVTQ